MKAEYQIRLLTTADVDIYRGIRLKALQTNTKSFDGLHEEEVLYSDEKFKASLERIAIFGIFYEDEIIGSAGLEISSLIKLKHNGDLVGFYVAPEHRGKGAGSKLLNHIIEYSRMKQVLQLSLHCISDGYSAIKFYEKHGFLTIGVYPRSLKSGDKFYDSNMMFLKLD